MFVGVACEASAEDDSSNQTSITIKYDRLLPSDVQPPYSTDVSQIDSSDISPSISTSSDDEFTTNVKASMAITSKPLQFRPNPIQSTANIRQCSHNCATTKNKFNSTICSDLRLSANKQLNKTIIQPMRPRFPPKRFATTTYDYSYSSSSLKQPCTLNEIGNRLQEKRQSDPQIRYAFYNKGFEVAAASRHRKLSFSQYESRRKTMPNINECGSIENDSDGGDDDDDIDDIAVLTKTSLTNRISVNDDANTKKKIHSYSGSSGRDITLLPKLKIRICDEMGKRVKSSFDESSGSDENLQKKIIDWFDDQKKTSSCSHNSNESYPIGTATVANPTKPASVAYFSTANKNNVENVDTATKCRKCGHKLSLQRQFSNAFI